MSDETIAIITETAAKHGVQPADIVRLMGQRHLSATTSSPCAHCQTAALPACRLACPALNLFRAFLDIEADHSPKATIQTTLGNVSTSIRRQHASHILPAKTYRKTGNASC